MAQAIEIFRWIHIPFGLMGLAVFWLPLVLKKGGRLHRRVGWLFVVCMGVASVTAAVLAVLRLIQGAQGPRGLTWGGAAMPVFLFMVSILTLASVHHGIAVLRQKKRTGVTRDWVSLAMPIVLLATSVFTLVVGSMTGMAVLFTLPIVGLLVGGQYLWTMVRRPRDPMYWWFQHMTGMLAGCIAAITAATVTNTGTLVRFVALPGWAFWIGPSLVLVPVLVVWRRVYARKFTAGSKRSRTDVSGASA